MADLVQWLQANNLTNPHAVPETLQDEFDALFGDTVIAWPQPGGQEAFMSSPADVVIYGGEAGGGKSWVLLQEACKWVDRPKFNAIVVRKTMPQIFGSDGLWWNAKDQYSIFGAIPKQANNPFFLFPSGAKVFFKHSQHAKDVDKNFQGLSGAYIAVDELTQFKVEEFLYFTSRNRGVSGFDSYVRCTCNPDPDSWVKELISWWIGEDGFIIQERSGVIRYYIYEDDRFVTRATKEELLSEFPHRKEDQIMSITFIRGYLEENAMMTEKDPKYDSRMANLTGSQKKSLSEGNWNHYDRSDAMFRHSNFNKYRISENETPALTKIVIGIDPAGSTKSSSDETGIIISGRTDKEFFPLDDQSGKYSPIEWAKVAVDAFDAWEADYIVAESNYGGAMVSSNIENYCKSIGRSDIKVKPVHASRSSKDKFKKESAKTLRAQPIATLYDAGLVHHVGSSRLKKLESEMASYVDGQSDSPNRLDALVWTITELNGERGQKKFRIG